MVTSRLSEISGTSSSMPNNCRIRAVSACHLVSPWYTTRRQRFRRISAVRPSPISKPISPGCMKNSRSARADIGARNTTRAVKPPAGRRCSPATGNKAIPRWHIRSRGRTSRVGPRSRPRPQSRFGHPGPAGPSRAGWCWVRARQTGPSIDRAPPQPHFPQRDRLERRSLSRVVRSDEDDRVAQLDLRAGEAFEVANRQFGQHVRGSLTCWAGCREKGRTGPAPRNGSIRLNACSGQMLDVSLDINKDIGYIDEAEPLEGIKRGLADVDAGRVTPLEKFEKDFRKKHGIPRRSR